jgi:hypothetical protein
MLAARAAVGDSAALVAQVPDLADLALAAQLRDLADLVVEARLPDLADLAHVARLPVLAHLVVEAEVLVELLSRQSFSAAMARSTP